MRIEKLSSGTVDVGMCQRIFVWGTFLPQSTSRIFVLGPGKIRPSVSSRRCIDDSSDSLPLIMLHSLTFLWLG